MTKRNRAQRMSHGETAVARKGALQATASPSTAVQAFSFGEPVEALNRREIMDMVECYRNDRWYEPPLSLDGLARAFRYRRTIARRSCSSTTSSPRRSVWCRGARPTRRRPCRGRHSARRCRTIWYSGTPISKRAGTCWAGSWICTTRSRNTRAAVSALLNEAATLFRRRYYLNGIHAGYILYATGDIDENDTDALREALKNSKGPGNFKNLFVHAPGGKDGSIKILPIAEVGAKDEFLGIKNATRDDVLAAHRTPPSVLGIVPAQGSQLGKISEAVDMFFELETLPLQMAFMEINDHLSFEAVRFTPRAVAPAKSFDVQQSRAGDAGVQPGTPTRFCLATTIGHQRQIPILGDGLRRSDSCLRRSRGQIFNLSVDDTSAKSIAYLT